jgi:hypothetical protein
MTRRKLPAKYGGELAIDVCRHCNGLWFDDRESLQLSPGATLHLFRVLYSQNEDARVPLVPRKKCPRCADTLAETLDWQRSTRFSYFSCPEHGRYITFFQFLREKNLVRQPSSAELAELCAKMKVVKCSNCGAPIELAAASQCSYCSAPVSILCEEHIRQTLQELQRREEKRTTVDPKLAARMVQAQLETDRAFRAMGADSFGNRFARSLDSSSDGADLVAAGACFLVKALFGLLG